MASKPTYEELEQSIKELEKESAEKNQAMEMLRDSENKYRTFFGNSLDALFITMPEGRILEANPAACEMFGCTEEELIQGGRNAVVDLDDKRLLHSIEERNRTGKFIGELTFKRKNGTKFPAEITSVIFKNRDVDERTSMIIRDITERRRAEEALRESEERYRLLLQNANDAVYVHAVTPDGPGRFLEVNDRACRMLGYTYNEFMTIDIPAIDVPEQQGRIPEILQQLFKTGHAIFETEQMAKDGRRIPVEVSARLFEFRGIPTVLSVVRDITERKRVENALRESEEKFKAIFEGSHDAITLTTERGKVIDCNHRALELFGLNDKEDFKNKRPSDFSPKFQDGGMEAPELARQYIIRCIESGKSQHFEWLHQCTTGEIIPTEVILTSYSLKGEKVIQASIRDITERKQVDDALRESKERFRQVVENIREVFWLKDVHTGRILYISPAYETIWGRTIEEMYREGPSFMENVYPDDKDLVSVSHRALYEENQPFDEEYRVVRPDQSIRWVRARCYPVFDMNGNMARYAGIAEDITEHKLAEDALRESDKKFRELFDSITDLIYTQDMEGRFLTVNPAMHSLFGYDIDEFIGRTGADFMKPELRPLYFSEYLEGIKKQGHFEGISPYFKKDGGRIYIEFRSKLVQSEHGAPYISGIGRNVTERVLAEKERKRSEKERERLQTQLIQAQKMESVGRLAGGVAHDFNNMLGVILGRTEMMLMGMNPEDPYYANLEEIQKAAKRSADLTRQLLAFARKQTISPKVLDLNDTVEGMLKMLRRVIGEDIDLVWRPNAHLWPVKMDAAQVDQILANLCVNARDAISGTGNVTIGTENSILDEIFCAAHTGFQPGQYAMLSVSDDGCGMNQEIQSHLFEPFFTTKEVGKGTGLGLATVYGIVKQNDGFIHVYSEPGQGTTFKIYIPRHEGGAVMEMAADSIEVTKGHGETLLLVEDDSGILAMGKAMLERLGYTVLTSGDPSQALTLAKAHAGRIHLLMTDVVMPQISGKDLAEQIKMLKPEIKILFMSGYTADIISNHGILERDVHFIQKPFSIKDLAAKVRQVLE